MENALNGYTEIQKRIVKLSMNYHINDYADFLLYVEDIQRELFIHYLALNDVDPVNSNMQNIMAHVFADTLQDDLNDFIMYMKEEFKDDSSYDRFRTDNAE